MLGRPAKEHKVLPRPLAIRNAQLLHGMEPLHSALDVALVSRRTNEATVEGVLDCDEVGRDEVGRVDAIKV